MSHQSEPLQDENEMSVDTFKGDHTRFVDYSFGNVQTQNLKVAGSFTISGIAMGNPVDGGTLNIPKQCSIVVLQGAASYTQLTINMPLQPEYGQMLSIVSSVNVANLSLNGAFGTPTPTLLSAGVPLRFIFVGTWFNI